MYLFTILFLLLLLFVFLYFVNKGFFTNENQILDNIHKINHIPGVIVQGRYDVVCPMTSAWELHQKWSKSQLIVINDDEHQLKLI